MIRLRISVSYYSEKRKGDILSRISSDVIELQVSFLGILELIVKEPLMIIFTLISMLLINSKLAIFEIHIYSYFWNYNLFLVLKEKIK